MNKPLIYLLTPLLFFMLIISSFSSAGQLIINQGMTTAQLVQNVLVGNGVTVTNINYTGGANAKGAFSNGSLTNLGLGDGIFLCTGIATQIANPVNYFMSANIAKPGDADLNNISNGAATYDASVLEFDFTPLSDTIRFRYVFGSEEYPQAVCSQYNDLFAFFISGPNPSGGNYNKYNIALIPGTTLPVAVNSVNNGNPGSSYSASGCTSLSYANYYVDNLALGGNTVTFDGFTIPLTAWCHVTPCQTYHIKLAVADGYNAIYDSGVFLEANSFSSNTFNVNVSYSDPVTGDSAAEGCSNGIFTFTLPSPAITPYIINFSIGGSAVNGVDYAQIQSAITIPAGQDSASVVISPVNDGSPEPAETVIITYTNGCLPQSDTVFIMNSNPIAVTIIDSITVCPGNNANIAAIANGGIAPYNFLWSDGTGSDTLAVSATTTTTYTVTVSDVCSQSATGRVVINVINVSASAVATDEICNQSNGTASVTVTGTCTGILTYLWNTLPQQSSPSIAGLKAGTYTVTVSCGMCTAVASATVGSISGAVINITGVANAGCLQSNGTATVSASQGSGNYTYTWSTVPPQNTATATGLSAGSYTVSVDDGVCCNTAVAVVGNTSATPVNINASATISTVMDEPIIFTGNSQGNIINWLWDFGDSTANASGQTVSHHYNFIGQYTVTLIATDSGGCTDTSLILIKIKEIFTLYIPNVFTPDGDGMNDIFLPQGLSVDRNNFEMSIYNRWGNLVFHTANWGEGWNGSENNSATYDNATMDVYVYRIKASEVGGKEYEYFGKIVLLK